LFEIKNGTEYFMSISIVWITVWENFYSEYIYFAYRRPLCLYFIINFNWNL